MFIKTVVKQNKKSKTKYRYLYLVESVRTRKGPRQRLILNLGKIDVPKEKHKELADCIKSILDGQSPLFIIDPIIEKHARNAAKTILEKRSRDAAINKKSAAIIQNRDSNYQSIDINSFEASTPRTIGPEYVCHSVMNELGIMKVLLLNGVPTHKLPIIEALLIGRLVDPGSERYTREWALNRSAIFELTLAPEHDSLTSFYRAGDALFDCKSPLEKHLSIREKEIFELPEQFCFFDLTNTYIEGLALANPKASRARSKEKRSDCKLLTLALIVDEHGFPKYSQFYSGNQSECKTLEEMINSLIEMRPALSKKRTVIMDAGIATDENIKFLRNEKKLNYIVVSRSKALFSPEDTEDMRVIFEDEDRNFKIEVKRHLEDDELYLLCKSSGRRQKDIGIRGRQEKLFLEALESAREGLTKKGCTKIYEKILERVGRVRQKYPKASKLYKIKVIPESDYISSKTKAMDILWEKLDKYDAEVKYEGCYVLRTDQTEMSDEEIWKTYIMLTRIERAFRCLKTELGLRPIFHKLENRSDTHMFISVLAYHVLHTIETRLRSQGDHRSWGTIRNILSTHQRLSIEYNLKEEGIEKHGEIRLCSIPEEEHRIIYHRLEVSDLPVGRRFTMKNL